MPNFLYLLGLIVALVSPLAFFVLPFEESTWVVLVGMTSGLVLFATGIGWRAYRHEHELAACLARYAALRGHAFMAEIPVHELDTSAGVLKRGTTKRCRSVVSLSIDNYPAKLFRWQYFLPHAGAAKHTGGWRERLVLLVSDWDAGVNFVLTPETIPEKFAILIGGQDIDFHFNGDEDEFSQTFRLRGNDQAKVRDFFDDELRAALSSHHTFAAEADRRTLVVWHESILAQNWRLEWHRSFVTVDSWLIPALDELVELAGKILQHGKSPPDVPSERLPLT